MKQCINNQFVRSYETMFSRTKSIKLSNIIMHNVNLANQKTVSFVFDWLSAHAVFDITRFPALSEHLTSFHTIWGYVNCSMETMECLSKCWCSVEIAMFCWLSQSWCSVDVVNINVSTEFEMTSDARQNSGKARYVKHLRFSLLIGPNDIVCYGVK